MKVVFEVGLKSIGAYVLVNFIGSVWRYILTFGIGNWMNSD